MSSLWKEIQDCKNTERSSEEAAWGVVKYPCCDKKFKDKFDMEKHRKKKEENLCDLCDKKFTNKFSFKHHMNDHFLDKIYECPTCQKHFKSSSYFEKHVKEAHKEYTCTICRKIFGLKQNLQRHEKTIHSVKVTAGKNFGSFDKNPSLKKDSLVTERSDCKHCQKTFSTKYRLKYHVKNHQQIETRNERVVHTPGLRVQ